MTESLWQWFSTPPPHVSFCFISPADEQIWKCWNSFFGVCLCVWGGEGEEEDGIRLCSQQTCSFALATSGVPMSHASPGRSAANTCAVTHASTCAERLCG